MMVRRCALKGALMAIYLQMGVCLNVSRILRDEDSKCNVNFDQKETLTVDLSYMFTRSELLLLVSAKDSPQFLPGLKALLLPFISLDIASDLEKHCVNKSLLKWFKLEDRSGKKFFRARHGSLGLRRAYQMDFKIGAEPMVRISGSLVLVGLELRFSEYNTTLPNGNYIGYNLAISMDLEVIYMVALEPEDTNVSATFHLEASGLGPMMFTDYTNCETVEKREDLNLGRSCSAQVLEEVTKWQGVRKRVVALIRPAIFGAIWGSFEKVIPDLAELTVAYAVMLTK